MRDLYRVSAARIHSRSQHLDHDRASNLDIRGLRRERITHTDGCPDANEMCTCGDVHVWHFVRPTDTARVGVGRPSVVVVGAVMTMGHVNI
jgi:hypothetical protein